MSNFSANIRDFFVFHRAVGEKEYFSLSTPYFFPMDCDWSLDFLGDGTNSRFFSSDEVQMDWMIISAYN